MTLLTIIQVFAVSVVPIALIKHKIIPQKFYLSLLVGVFLVIAGMTSLEDKSAFELGFRMDTAHSAVIAYAIISCIVVIFLILLAFIMKNKHASKWNEDPHFLFLFIPISFAQQFIFQGFILTKLQEVISPGAAILLTALLFGYMHTIYPKPLLSLILGTSAGVLFAALYTFYPNMFVASISHAILNFTAVYLGFFTFINRDGTPKKTNF